MSEINDLDDLRGMLDTEIQAALQASEARATALEQALQAEKRAYARLESAHGTTVDAMCAYREERTQLAEQVEIQAGELAEAASAHRRLAEEVGRLRADNTLMAAHFRGLHDDTHHLSWEECNAPWCEDARSVLAAPQPPAAAPQFGDAEAVRRAGDDLLTAFVKHRTATHTLGRTKLGEPPCVTCKESDVAMAQYREAGSVQQ